MARGESVLLGDVEEISIYWIFVLSKKLSVMLMIRELCLSECSLWRQ